MYSKSFMVRRGVASKESKGRFETTKDVHTAIAFVSSGPGRGVYTVVYGLHSLKRREYEISCITAKL